MVPFKLSPAFKDYLWGGHKLKTDFSKQTPLEIVAESWELSAHADGDSIIADGEFAGMPFSQYVKQNPQALGSKRQGDEFPILIKLIDAAQSLSIQVHPDDTYAYRVEGEPGKTEMWYILDCLPGASLYFGFRDQISPEEVRRRIADNTITDVLYPAPVKKGDVFFIHAGTVHAIGAGILLAEIQQNSNTTYRVYDFGRKGADGKLRPLHVEKALEVAVLGPAQRQAPEAAVLEDTKDYCLRRLARCTYFDVMQLDLQSRYTHTMDQSSFVSVLCTFGTGTLSPWGLPIQKGDSIFIPAGEQEFVLEGQGEFLLTML